ncbi:hypothetical protein [Kluyvera sichuanensis]|uniref:hypothetical protein n=1 Tax=Kluyvera sichuanensis TaxID=2725494 RepID=UPI0039F4C71A
MSDLKKWLIRVCIAYLRSKKVPQYRWPEQIKKTGSWFFLGGTLPVLVLLIMNHAPLALIIIFQLMFLACMFIGHVLVNAAKE